jgi:hypothetical protein
LASSELGRLAGLPAWWGSGRFAGGRQRGRQADRGGGLENLAARRIGGLAGFRQLLVVMRVLHGFSWTGGGLGR